MCGIVGYMTEDTTAIDVVLHGLELLEYRGYDSAGITYRNGTKLITVRETGRVETLRTHLETSGALSNQAIGHTRWATHGAATVVNAHPHTNTDGTIAVVHNGIIENYAELKERLQARGYVFVSETDTEVIPHLIDFYLQMSKTFMAAFEKALRDLEGAYGLAVVTAHDPGALYVARLGSPLVIAHSTDSVIVASDPMVLPDHMNEVVFLKDCEYGRLRVRGNHQLKHLVTGDSVNHDTHLLADRTNRASKGTFPHYMLKEIYEIPQTVQMATAGRLQRDRGMIKLGGLEAVRERLSNTKRIVIVACGTSYYAGLVGEYVLEEIAGIPVEVQYASEFKYRTEPLSRGTAVLAISQSGETADTIAALKKVEQSGVLKLGIVNVVGSTIARITDAGVYCHAGPELAVASTKAFVSQVTVLLELAVYLAGKRSAKSPLFAELEVLPAKCEEVLTLAPQIEQIAKRYASAKDFLYIGRGYAFPTALEGALKLKECSYVHAEGYAAGEMKHGPLALIDEAFPTFALATDSPLMAKTYSNIEEIKARNGKVIAVASEGNASIIRLVDDVIYIPKTLEQTSPILTAIVMQLFAYYVAVERGYDVDKPRNLAKSVTVE